MEIPTPARLSARAAIRARGISYPSFFSRSWIIGVQTDAGLSDVILQMAAVIRLAEPMIALAWTELGSSTSSSTACQLWPDSASGEYIAPTDVYLLPKSMNGMVRSALYLPKIWSSDADRVISGCC